MAIIISGMCLILANLAQLDRDLGESDALNRPAKPTPA